MAYPTAEHATIDGNISRIVAKVSMVYPVEGKIIRSFTKEINPARD
jgi:hypothetical protein